MRHAVLKDATRCYGSTTTKNERMHQQDDHHLKAPALKDRWPGHPSIPPRVFGPSQYLMMPLVQLTKPKSTSKPTSKLKLTLKLLLANSTLKLVPPETQSDAEEF